MEAFQPSVTLNSVIVISLRYFTKLCSFGGQYYVKVVEVRSMLSATIT